MAAAITEANGVDVDLIGGSKGVFEIAVRGEVILQKTVAGFPTPEDCASAVKDALAT